MQTPAVKLSDAKQFKRFIAGGSVDELLALERKLYKAAKVIWAELDKRKRK